MILLFMIIASGLWYFVFKEKPRTTIGTENKNYIAYIKSNSAIKLSYGYTCLKYSDNTLDCDEPVVYRYELVNDAAKEKFNDTNLLEYNNELLYVINLVCEKIDKEEQEILIQSDWNDIELYIKNKITQNTNELTSFKNLEELIIFDYETNEVINSQINSDIQEEQKRKEQEELLRKQEEERLKKEAEEKAKKEQEEKARKEKEAKAKKEAEEKARKQKEEQLKKEQEEKEQQENNQNTDNEENNINIEEKIEAMYRMIEGRSILTSLADINLQDTDGNGKNYVFTYNNKEYTAVYTTDNWHIVNSYQIRNRTDLAIICQALILAHPIHGKDRVSYRTVEDLVYEWVQHNVAYYILPNDNPWKNNAKDVDLDPDDQGLSLVEIYESRTGLKFNISDFIK